MRKLILSLSLLLLFTLVAGPILAEENATTSTRPLPLKIKDRLENKLENRTTKVEIRLEERLKQLDKVRRQAVERVRKALLAHWNVLNKAVERVDKLLGKLQLRIDKAKVAGKDTSEAEKLMAEAKEKLAQAKENLAEIKELKENSVTKDEFTTIRGQIKEIWQDLQVVKQNAAKIIRILKGFNSATSSGQNPQREGTSPGLRLR